MAPTDFKELDSGLFKAFRFAAQELNFTRAAQRAAMTQSGISQKVAKLGAQVGRPLFLRVNKTVSLTAAGQILLHYIDQQQDGLDKLFLALGHEATSVSGRVRYAMPHSCLFTPHFAHLLRAREGFPQVRLKVELCANEAVVDRLLERRIDFGFVTQFSDDPAIEHAPFAVEEYVLVGRPSKEARSPSARLVSELPFVNYPGLRSLFQIWKNGHFPASRSLNFSSLGIAGETNGLSAAVSMVVHGVGWSVMPRHVIERERLRGELCILPGTESKKVMGDIFIVTLKGCDLPARVKVVLSAFEKMKRAEPPRRTRSV